MKNTILLALKLYCEEESTYFPFLIFFTERMGHLFPPQRRQAHQDPFYLLSPHFLLLLGNKMTYLIGELVLLCAFCVYLLELLCLQDAHLLCSSL